MTDKWAAEQQRAHNLASYQRREKRRPVRRPTFTIRQLQIAEAAAAKEQQP